MNATPARMSLIFLMACSACERSRGGPNDKPKSIATSAVAPPLAVSATAAWGNAGAANASAEAGQGAAGQEAAGSASLPSGERHCKALGKRVLVSVGILRDRLIDIPKHGVFIHATAPYATEEWTYSLPWSGGKPKQLEYWKALDPNESPVDVGIRGLAVDDGCVYTARRLQNYLAIYGRSHG